MSGRCRCFAVFASVLLGASPFAQRIETGWISMPDHDYTQGGGMPLELADDGKTVVAGLEGGRISVRSAPNLLVTQTVKATTSPVRAIAVSKDVSLVAVGGQGGELSIVDLHTGKVRLLRPAVINRLIFPGGPWPVFLKFSGNGDRLFALFGNGSLWLGDTGTGATLLSRFTGYRSISTADVTTALDSYVLYDGAGHLQLFDTWSGGLLRTFGVDRGSTVRPFFSPSGSRLAALAYGTRRLTEFDVATGAVVTDFSVNGGGAGGYSSDEREFVLPTFPPTVYNMATGVGRVLTYRFAAFSAYNTASDRLFLGFDQTAQGYYWNASQEILRASDGQVEASTKAEGYSRTLAFSPDGQYIVQAAVMTPPIVRRVSGEFVDTLAVPYGDWSEQRPDVAFSPDGTYVAVSSQKSLSVCSMWNGSVPVKLSFASPQFPSPCFTSDGSRLLYLKDGALRALLVRGGWQDVLINSGPFQDLQTSKQPWVLARGDNALYLGDVVTGVFKAIVGGVETSWGTMSQQGNLLYVSTDGRIDVHALPSGSKVKTILLADNESATSVAPMRTEGDFLVETWNVWRQTDKTFLYRNGQLTLLEQRASPSGDTLDLVASPVDDRFSFAGSGSYSGVSSLTD